MKTWCTRRGGCTRRRATKKMRWIRSRVSCDSPSRRLSRESRCWLVGWLFGCVSLTKTLSLFFSLDEISLLCLSEVHVTFRGASHAALNMAAAEYCVATFVHEVFCPPPPAPNPNPLNICISFFLYTFQTLALVCFHW